MYIYIYSEISLGAWGASGPTGHSLVCWAQAQGPGPKCMNMHWLPLVFIYIYIYIYIRLYIYIYSAIVPAFFPFIKYGSGGKNTIVGSLTTDVEARTPLSNTDCLRAI